MLTFINRRNLGAKVARASAMCLLALGAALFEAREARAQWTQPDASGNINSTNTGGVGIGTTAPNSKLHSTGTVTVGPVDGDIYRMFGLTDSNARWAITNSAAGVFGIAQRGDGWADQGTRFLIDRSGNVGVGTLSPASPLSVNSDSNVTPLLVTGNNTNVVGLAVSNTQAGSKAWAFQVAGPNHLNSVPNGSLILRQATDDINSLVISKMGNVGVGTTAPVSKLHVVGDITVTGNINAKYQDLAEWVPSVEKLSAGTVVILDVARDNHVAASSTSYDTRVAGVISAQPGIALGEAGEGKVLVATTGRVKVRVDATQGPINVGDLLVTSDRQGFAMKSEPVQVGKRQMHSPGTIIGKALESLAGGTGEILVLLSLQ